MMVQDGAARLDGESALTARFTRQLSAAAAARRWVQRVLDDAEVVGQARQEIVLVASELVTNAVRHGLGEIEVTVALEGTDERYVQLSVTDSGPGVPTVQEIDPDRIGGLGLQIVSEVAARWGVAAVPGGKTVWALLPATR